MSIGSPEKMEPITKVSHIPSSRWALVCSLCNEKFGASIQVITLSEWRLFPSLCSGEQDREGSERTILSGFGDGTGIQEAGHGEGQGRLSPSEVAEEGLQPSTHAFIGGLYPV